ncbi:Pr6Pr family membrane protein [Demequina zhanjiangensis]|uniref:Pr6Pr family membrane protein n=1 Tax=Demequina zhanjiangensis TaxID=3051659 RepID=A0ABT8G060_9MICO|nr:Pr6Pr family membrane protein [Demequina sp. SYSU T00b26]MDN4472467.1 Pr6Pr family membrane protein [Demequina sp. SYSU T00b26]
MSAVERSIATERTVEVARGDRRAVAIVGTWRLTAGAVIAIALVADALTVISEGGFVFWDYFGYFSVQTMGLGAVVLLGMTGLTGRSRPALVEHMRLAVTAYLLLSAAFYWALIYPVQAASSPWINIVMHGGASVVLLVDWLVEGPRRAPSRTALWTGMIYPIVWMVVFLVRGATDGWTPYEALDPVNGYAMVAVQLGGSFLAILIALVVLRNLTRWRWVDPEAAKRR